MKKNYFAAFKKSVGFFPVLILGFMLAIVAYASFNDAIFRYVKQSESLIGILLKRVAPALFITLGVVGLVGLRSPKVGLMDTFRLSNVFGVVLAVLLLFLTSNMQMCNKTTCLWYVEICLNLSESFCCESSIILVRSKKLIWSNVINAFIEFREIHIYLKPNIFKYSQILI